MQSAELLNAEIVVRSPTAPSAKLYVAVNANPSDRKNVG